MIIRAVDYRDTHIFAAKLLGCLETAKAGADNYDPGFLFSFIHRSDNNVMRTKPDARLLFAAAAGSL